MPSDTTARNFLRSTRVEPRRRSIRAAVSPGLASARAWFAANLLALAGAGTGLGGATPDGLVIGWVCFTVLNATLYLAVRSRANAFGASAIRRTNACFAALLGLAWGGGMVLLLPTADTIGITALLSAALAVAVTALPALAGSGSAYACLVLTLGTLASAATVLDGRYPLAALWALFSTAGLLVSGKAYADNQARLRGILLELLLGRSAPAGSGVPPDDDVRALLAREHLDAFDNAQACLTRQRTILQGLGQAVLVTDADGYIEYANPRAEVLLGWTRKDLLGCRLEQALRIAFPPTSGNHARPIFEELRRTRRTQTGNASARLLRQDGVVRALDYTATALGDDDGEFAGAVFMLRDVTEQRNRTGTIAWQATHDSLTGTINRGEFEVRLKQLVRRAQDDQANTHALLHVDVDTFRAINDCHGHAAGDLLLRELAEALRTRIRGADTLARIGGDEFAVLLYNCAPDRARLVAEGMRSAVERHPFRWQHVTLPLSLSIGVATLDRGCRSAADLLRCADAACKAAKGNGRNRVEASVNGASASGCASLPQARVFDFVRDIRTVIEGRRLELSCRSLVPLGETTAGNLRCCELSVGSRDANGKNLPRARLAELAARYQLSEAIDRWLIDAAVDALRLGHPALSGMALVMLPVSARTLRDVRQRDYLLERVHANPEAATRLGFNMSVAGFSDDPGPAAGFLGALRKFGCRILLRDVELGARSVALLQSLPAEYLAIPAPLVAAMTRSPLAHEVVAGLARSAFVLGLEPVAETVADDVQRAALAALGIESAFAGNDAERQNITIHSAAQWI